MAFSCHVTEALFSCGRYSSSARGSRIDRAKRASAYIVMGIVGGALLPKLMGAIADHYNMSRGFIVPLICFVFIALYGYCWPKLSRAESLHGVSATGGH